MEFGQVTEACSSSAAHKVECSADLVPLDAWPHQCIQKPYMLYVGPLIGVLVGSVVSLRFAWR